MDVQLWLYDTEKLREDVARCEDNFKRTEFDLQTVEDAMRDLEIQNDRLFEISQSNKTESENLLREIRRQTEINHTLDSEYRVGESNISHTRELIAAAMGTCESTQRSIAAEETAIKERLVNIESIEAALAEKEKQHADTAKLRDEAAAIAEKLSFDIDRALGDVHVINADIADVKARISFIDNSKDTDTDKNTAMQAEIASYEAESEKLRTQIDRTQKTVEQYETASQGASEEAMKLTGELADLYVKRQDDNEDLSAVRLRRESAQQRIDNFKAMEEQLEGYSGSVRYVMKKYAEGGITDKHGAPCGKIYGPLSKLIDVEDRYVTAIETALGPNLQHIVVEDENVAKAAMFALKRAEAGRATFFPLTTMRGQSETPEMKEASGYRGYIAVADELVGSDGKFSEILSGLLGRTVVF